MQPQHGFQSAHRCHEENDHSGFVAEREWSLFSPANHLPEGSPLVLSTPSFQPWGGSYHCISFSFLLTLFASICECDTARNADLPRGSSARHGGQLIISSVGTAPAPSPPPS